MRKTILLGTLVLSLLVLGAFLVSAQLDKDTATEPSSEPEISTQTASCGQGICGASCDQSCGGSCGMKTCGCGR